MRYVISMLAVAGLLSIVVTLGCGGDDEKEPAPTVASAQAGTGGGGQATSPDPAPTSASAPTVPGTTGEVRPIPRPASPAQSSPAESSGPGVTLRINDAATGSPNVTGASGGKVTMKVVVEGADNVAGAQFKLKFNSSVVRVADDGIVQGQIPHGFIFQTNPDNDQGEVTVAMAGGSALGVSMLSMMDVTFDLVGSAGQTTDIVFIDEVIGVAADPPQRSDVSTSKSTITIR